MSQQPFIFVSGGGLDLITPPLQIKPGRLTAGSNYECGPRGYTRCGGYERFDGRLKPSEANYWVLGFNTGTAAIVTGNTVTGLASGATGLVILDAIVDSGSYGGGNAVGRLIITETTGTFVLNEQLQVAAVTKSHATGPAVSHGATNDTDEMTWEALAIERRRALIAALPGEGPTRGLNLYKGILYGLRNNVGSTACLLYKESAAGWVLQNLGREVAFTSGGVYQIAEGDVITGATSGATATIGRILLTSGTWAGGTAAGRLIITANQTGVFVAENLNVGANLNVATIAGNSTAHALLPNGRFAFTNHNFFGAATTIRMYGVDGANRAWEWDGATMVPIITGIVDDTPDYIAVHKQHLMLGFKEGSVQTTDIGTPYSVTALGGAVEIAVGYELTGLIEDLAGLLGVFCKDAVLVLYGSAASDWDLRSLAEDAGAFAWTMQMLSSPIYMDDRGVRSLSTTQNYANFVFGTYSEFIQPLFDTKKAAGVTPVASMRCRAKAQYLLFFSDNTGVSIYLGKQSANIVTGVQPSPQCLFFDLGRVVSVCVAGLFADGSEGMFFGSDNGMVYQRDKGNSYDGAAVDAYIRYPFTNCQSPQWEKRFHKATLEVDAPANANISMSADFSYGAADNPVATQSFSVSGGGGFWSEMFWSQFYWSSPVSGTAEAYFDGLGETISVVVASKVTYEPPHTISGMRLHHSRRRLIR